MVGTARHPGEPPAVEDLLNRGLARYEQHDYARAIRHFSGAIRLAPTNPDAYFHRGNAHRYLGDFAAAQADYSEAIRYDPYYALAYYNRAMLRKENSEIDGAIVDLERYLDVCTGMCEEDRAEVEQSIRDLRRLHR